MIHVGDAPQHGPRFHDFGGGSDDFYGAEPRGLVAEDLFKQLKQIGIQYFFGKIRDSTDKMYGVFQSIGGKDKHGNDVVREVDLSDPSQLKIQAVASITGTIEQTLAGTVTLLARKRIGKAFAEADLSAVAEESEDGGSTKSLKTYTIIATDHEGSTWDPEESYKWLDCVIEGASTLDDIKRNIGSINHKWSEKSLKKAKHPFSEGAQRISFHGLRMDKKQKIVLKEFKHFGSGRDGREDYIQNMETQCVAEYLAEAFNRQTPVGSKKITFLKVS